MIRSQKLRVVTGDPPPLLRALLDEQQDLSAVDRFARACDSGAQPAGERTYRDLLPASPPAPGQQYAFEVDLDACSGCKSCVAACHHLNGLDEGELWRTVGLLVGGTSDAPVQQTVTTSCHHCVDPACMRGCPVKAYEKDPLTGIVVHLDDQCFGCRYCTLMCPYDAPRYSARRGVVRKCDMCRGRLAAGEAPACVQACPSQAIRIAVVDVAQALEDSAAGQFLPGTATPADTVPTTRYTTRRARPDNLLPADYHAVQPGERHLPLVFMLVLTQMSVGAYVVAAAATLLSDEIAVGLGRGGALLALCLGLGALAASIAHLGRPHLAYRALLGLGTSWLSREIAAFSLFAALATVHAGSYWIAELAPWGAHLAALTAAAGAGAVACSVMVYAATRREHWHAAVTATRFFGTTLVLGCALVLLVTASAGAVIPRQLLVLMMTGAAGKLLFDLAMLRHRRDRRRGPHRRVAELMLGQLRPHTLFRFMLAGAGGLLIPALLLAGAPADGLVVASLVGPVFAFAACLLGELLERHLFFTAAPASRMPGGVA